MDFESSLFISWKENMTSNSGHPKIIYVTITSETKRSIYFTYSVPTTLWVFAPDSSCWQSLAIPKSEIFGFISWSSNMFPVFKSRWIIFNLEYLCRYRSPWATPSMMLKRFFQSRSNFLPGSVLVQVKTYKGFERESITTRTIGLM